MMPCLLELSVFDTYSRRFVQSAFHQMLESRKLTSELIPEYQAA
jgi:hypothetical protein